MKFWSDHENQAYGCTTENEDGSLGNMSKKFAELSRIVATFFTRVTDDDVEMVGILLKDWQPYTDIKILHIYASRNMNGLRI